MRITIDNLDGRGALDYSPALLSEAAGRIERTLNGPTRFTAELLLGAENLPLPLRKGRVVACSEAGEVLFTGYLVVEPSLRYLGVDTPGPVYAAQINAFSDEWLLDKQRSNAATAFETLFLESSSASITTSLIQTIGATAITVVPDGNARAVGIFAITPGTDWSTNAAAAANASYSAYRVLEGTVTVSSAGGTAHALQDGDGSFVLSNLQVSQLRELANDVTLSGAEEATTYVQELFLGDGTTAIFPLSAAAFRGDAQTLVLDRFEEALINATQWILKDTGNYIRLTGSGLAAQGGNGSDGQTTLTSRSAVEIGGALNVVLAGVTFGAGSDGMLAGFYDAGSVLANCFAGFRVRQNVSSTGSVTQVVPVVRGSEVGLPFTPQANHKYTLRLRTYSIETQRVPQRYYCMVDGKVQSFGSTAGLSSPVHLVFELLDEGLDSNTPATVLYDSVSSGAALADAPALCTFVALNSTGLQVSFAGVSVKRTGSLWVTSTLPDGTNRTRLMGDPGQGADCVVEAGSETGTPGKLTFFAGRVPQAGERITAYYRRAQRAVARLADNTSVEAEAAAGVGISVAGTSCWLGSILQPIARSSVDCEAAAQAVLAMATSRSAAVAGSCVVTSPVQDMWPGDLLQLDQNGSSISALIRSVDLESLHAEPELLRYRLAFANDWATQWKDGLGIRLTPGCAHDAYLPLTALAAPGAVLPNLQQLNVLNLTETAVQIDAGCDAPAGGGFEVRRRPEEFGTIADIGDLVLRSPVRSFSLPRSAQVERFYVRMYDGNVVPLYSRFSSALYVNWPFEPAA